MAKKTIKTAAKQSAFSIDLKVNGTLLHSTGATIADAVLALPSFVPKTVGTLVINGSKPIPYNIPSLKRLFYPGMTGQVQRTQLTKKYAFYAR